MKEWRENHSIFFRKSPSSFLESFFIYESPFFLSNISIILGIKFNFLHEFFRRQPEHHLNLHGPPKLVLDVRK